VPGTIRKISSSAMPFKQMENVSHYVDACQALGVPAQDLFMTVDLYEGKDMRAVVRNLHSLGRVAQVARARARAQTLSQSPNREPHLHSPGRAAQTIDGYAGPMLGARLASANKRHFSERQMAEARAMPARWTNVGKAGTVAR
jgi:hypothetical protein